MIMEILLKLNVKSLVRCKSVCKSWLYLISDSHFKKLHFDLSAATEKFMFVSNRKLLTIDFNASLHYDSSCVHFKVPHRIFHPYYFKFGGSCRGFLVLESWKHKYLWNPCTGFYKQVCMSPIEYSLENNPNYDLLFRGLGYDPLTDDYLVVQLFNKLYSNDRKYAEVFSIRANKWMEIEPVNLSFTSCYWDNYRPGRVLNNVIYWLGCSFKEETTIFILGFDVTERMFFEIAAPVDVAPVNFANSMDRKALSEVAGLLSLCVYKESNHSIEIWSMKEYRVESSWTKTSVVSLVVPCRLINLLYVTKDGDIVGKDENKLIK
ncbi:F-box/kelch-repeat protein At3g23880-like, partial [Vigna radiata var. radiata]|uniref:F-box/kelch-repeat protein At3g23880-like n=1 Tax=Vigna radiata var. radiata TaxID=3916 RepID=A0A3Q0F771_VIGRR